MARYYANDRWGWAGEGKTHEDGEGVSDYILAESAD